MNLPDDLLHPNHLQIFDGVPLCYQLSTVPEDLSDWVVRNRPAVTQILQQQGALLLRGLNIQGSKKLETLLTTIFGEELLEYTYRSTPRTQMRGRIYTSTEYHASETILQHNENAYSNKWPMRIAFNCVKNAEEGGQTPICDSRVIYRQIPAEIRAEFSARKLLYVRNYNNIDLHWTEVFQTQDKAEVEQYCRQNRIEFAWLAQDHLKTWQRNPAVCRHPVTDEWLWFNQAHLFHISSQPAELQRSLLDVLGEGALPRNVYFGDGAIIPDDMIAVIRQVYEQHLVVFDWQDGDLLLLDNMLYAHGRRPFSGSRKILTGMAGLHYHPQPTPQPLKEETV